MEQKAESFLYFMSYMLKQREFYFNLFLLTLVLVMDFFWLLIVFEILYLKLFCWNLYEWFLYSNSCRFLESFKVLVQIFFFFSGKRLDYMVYSLSVMHDEQRYGVDYLFSLLVSNKQSFFVTCFYILLYLKIICWFYSIWNII